MKFPITYIFGFCLIQACSFGNVQKQTMEVTATAYNSLVSQTDGDPIITAFGDSLIPGKKYIAVSRDLLAMGLKHNSLVKIEGLEGMYLVKDKMHKRWEKRIDLYMGTDVAKARQWGKRKVLITFEIPLDLNSQDK